MQSRAPVHPIHNEKTAPARPWQSRVTLIRAIQAEQGSEMCFMTEKRLLCKDLGCEWRRECRRLIAVWKR